MVMAAQEAAAVAAEQVSALPSDRTTTAEQADSSPPAKVDAAVQVDVSPKPAAQVGHADVAVQVVCPAQGQQVLLPPMECKLPLSLPLTNLCTMCETDSVLIRNTTTIRTAQVSLKWMEPLPIVLSGPASVASKRNSLIQKKHWKNTTIRPMLL